MLKKLVLNKRLIPIPVPIQTLEQAVTWLSQTLIKHDEEITKIIVNGNDMISELGTAAFATTRLNENTRLEVQADSPWDLALQSLDAVRNLALVIERSLKVLAVRCWQTPPNQSVPDIKAMHADMILMRDLCEHVRTLVGSATDTSVLLYLAEKMIKIRTNLISQADKPDWQSYARVLLNKLEPILPELASQAEAIQSYIYSHLSEKNIQETESGVFAREGVTSK